MSALLDTAARSDPERSQALDRSDEQMADNLPEIFRIALRPFAPPPFTESELLAADVAYLEGQARRDRELVRFLQEQELNMLRNAGGL